MLRQPVTAVALLIASSALAGAQSPEWPNWRGPTSDGHAAADAQPPLEWSEQKNIRYKVELPGLGCSSPIIHGDSIYLTTAIDLEGPGAADDRAQPGDPNADHEHEYFVFCLDRESGDELWRTSVGKGKPHEKGHRTGSHASASINTDGEHIVAFFGSRGLHVLDTDGELLWSKDFGDMKTLVEFGEGSTPILHDGRVVVQWDEEQPSFVAAYEVATGDELWRQERKSDSTWGSPVVATVNDKPQVILTGSDQTVSYDLASGNPIWHCAGMSKNPVNSPTVGNGHVYVMNSYKGKIIQAINLAEAKGEVKAGAGLTWATSRDASYVPNPVVHDGKLYYLRDSTGVVNCVDASTGERHYTERLGAIKRIHACPIVAQDRIYITAREEGVTMVLKAGSEFEVLATNQLDDVFDATPAMVGDEIYLRGRTHLYCIAEG